jgi:2-phosphosulfolactate phosphatase
LTARRVVIDCFAENVDAYRDGFAVVAVDVFRSTTTAVTAAARGFKVYPVESLDAALELARRLPEPLLAGELGGSMPFGFDLQNSPAELDRRTDVTRPIVLLSTSGTGLIVEARGAEAVYVACLRNVRAQVALAARHENVAVVGAGTRGEFREEDQLCCAWIAGALVDAGFDADSRTLKLVERWRASPVEAIVESDSAEYLRRSGQEEDLEFVLSHVDDVDAGFVLGDDGAIYCRRRG